MKEVLNKTLLQLVPYMISMSLFAGSGVLAKPMPTPRLEQAVKQSTIVIAEYKGIDKSSKIDYFSGVKTRYKLIRYITSNKKFKKMPQSGQSMKVNFQFDDGTACIAPKPWKFNEKEMMPPKNSKWLLFLSGKNKGIFQTYRGSWGRKAFTPEAAANMAVLNRN